MDRLNGAWSSTISTLATIEIVPHPVTDDHRTAPDSTSTRLRANPETRSWLPTLTRIVARWMLARTMDDDPALLQRVVAAWKRHLALIRWGAAGLYVALFAFAPRNDESPLAHASFVFFMTTITAWIVTIIVLAWIDHMANDWEEAEGAGKYWVIRGAISFLSDDVASLGRCLEASRFRRCLVPFGWFGARACVLGVAVLLALAVADWL